MLRQSIKVRSAYVNRMFTWSWRRRHGRRRQGDVERSHLVTQVTAVPLEVAAGVVGEHLPQLAGVVADASRALAGVEVPRALRQPVHLLRARVRRGVVGD